tara:strand:+ start:42 stop:221 length:180 start_codon:yes stop_codon:yes gene_type:complete
MDYVRGTIASALADGLTLEDVWQAAEHAQSLTDFDAAVQMLSAADAAGMAWTETGWVTI